MANALLAVSFDERRPVEEIHRALATRVLIRGRTDHEVAVGRKHSIFAITTLSQDEVAVQQNAIHAMLGSDVHVLGVWY